MKKLLTISLCTLLCSTMAAKSAQFQLDEPPGFKNLVHEKAVEPILFSEEQLLELRKQYKKITKEDNVIMALEMLKGTVGDFSRNAILGNNLTGKPIKVEFKNLASINPQYATFDALGWKRSNKLYIFINEKHKDAPKAALSALLAHEAIHQDELNSLNEETYAWTLEAAVWTQLCNSNPAHEKHVHPLVNRQNTLKKLFEKGDYTSKYIKKTVIMNPGYQNLPSRSPGFEDTDNL